MSEKNDISSTESAPSGTDVAEAAEEVPKRAVAFDTAVPVNDNNTPSAINRRKQFRNKKQYQGFSVPSTADELHHAKERWEEESWQLKALHFINSDIVQKVLICLLLLDVVILFTELAIDAFYPACKLVVRDAISCCPVEYNANSAYDAHYTDGEAHNVHRFLAGGGGGDLSHEGECTNPLEETDYQAGCHPAHHHAVHVAHEALFWTTIVILLTFELELLFLIYLLGLKKFFHQMFYVVDLFVVTVSLVLELVFRMASNSAMEALPGILIIFRLWRFIRIGHGLVASTYEVQEHKTHLAMEHIAVLENRLKIYEDEIPELPKKLQKGVRASDTH